MEDLLHKKQTNAKKIKAKTLKKELQSRILQLQAKNNMMPDELGEWNALREEQVIREADLAELNAEKIRLTMRSHVAPAPVEHPKQTSPMFHLFHLLCHPSLALCSLDCVISQSGWCGP